MSDIDQQQSFESQSPINREHQKLMAQMRQAHSQIDHSFQRMNELKQEFFLTQQQKFIKTFMNIMDRMSNDLQTANQAYQRIDQEIRADSQCIFLANQLDFFQNQCLTLRKELGNKKQILKVEALKNKQLLWQKDRLQKKLYGAAARELKYKSKAKSLFARRATAGETEVSRARTFFQQDNKKGRLTEVLQRQTQKIKQRQHQSAYAKKRNYSVGTSMRESSSFNRMGQRQSSVRESKKKKTLQMFSNFKQT